MLLQAILVGIIAGWQIIDEAFLWSSYTYRPLCIGFLIGLALGDIPTGVMTGASLELVFIGAISMGSYVPPDASLGTAIATAFVIHSGMDLGAALVVATPIAVISSGFKNIIYVTLSPIIKNYGICSAAKGNEKGIYIAHFTMAFLLFIYRFFIAFAMYYFGSEAVSSVLSELPDWVTTSFSIVSGILPAVGFAMLLNMVFNTKTLPYLFLGFILSSYLGMSMLGVLALSIIIVLLTVNWSDHGKEAMADDTDF
ncbi:PTS sugar transporter subunit IIC [Massilicoli timonensis]|uniref:PTS mannose/fructose/sorbose/N-acetylgalactosamine transporter subunit IIC n=1 Tax=Massilicoli timonensis TaxID=2015901 RepID=UPI00307A77E0